MRRTDAGPGIRSAFVIAALMSSASLAQEAAVEGSLQLLSMQQLCAQRSSPAAWLEIERRGVFSDRELRAIRKEKVRTGVGVDAISCFLGPPQAITPVVFGISTDRDPGQFELYIYASGDEATLVAVEHDGGRSTVVDWHGTGWPVSYDGTSLVMCNSDGCTFPGEQTGMSRMPGSGAPIGMPSQLGSPF